MTLELPVSAQDVLDWTWEQMAIDTEAGLVLNWPSMRPVSAWWMNRGREEQERETEKTLGVIEKLFDDARVYRDMKLKPEGKELPTDLRFEAMQGVLPPPEDAAKFSGQKPVFVMANDYDQIVAAVEFGTRRGLKVVIVGGMDAHFCADELKRHDVPVIISKTSGVAEVLQHALKVDFWDIEEMANKIIAVLRHPPLSSTLREHADMEVRQLTWDGAATKCRQVYQKAMAMMPR